MESVHLTGVSVDEVRSRALQPHTFRDVIRIGSRHRAVILLSFLGVLAGAIIAAALQPDRYTASMKILVKRDRADPIVTPDPTAVPSSTGEVTEEELNSEVAILKSRDLLEHIVRICNLQTRTPNESGQIAKAVRKLDKDLRVEVIKKTNLIEASYQAPDPRTAALVLNTLANLYFEKHVEVHRPSGAFDFFQRESDKYRRELQAGEQRLLDFNRQAQVVSAPVEKQLTLERLAELQLTLKQTNAAIAETERRTQELQQTLDSMPARTVAQTRNTDDGLLIAQLRGNLVTLEQKRIELLGKFEPTYRPIQELDKQIAGLRTALSDNLQLHEETTEVDPTYQWTRSELAKAKADLVSLQARAEATNKAVHSYQENARALGAKEVVQADLMRSIKATEDNYLLSQRKEEEARISDALDRGRILNVALAEAPTAPVLPSSYRLQTIGFGFLLSIVVSAALALVAERMDSTFRTADEVAVILNVPVLAALQSGGSAGNNGLRIAVIPCEPQEVTDEPHS